MNQSPASAASESPTARCYGCYRPHDRCFCHCIPRVDNQTAVLIVQHMRERFHPFNTARIVKRALSNSSLLSEPTNRMSDAIRQWTGDRKTGLLYPGEDAMRLEDVTVENRPSQLIVLDGTWHHTKTLVRDIPLLSTMPRYSLSPQHPSTYRIRREPNAACISTLEATVSALKCLEPETVGLDELLVAFNYMIDSQLSLPMPDYGKRRLQSKIPGRLHSPRVLRESLGNVVVVYGETLPGEKGDRGDRKHNPVVWMAERLVSGERFQSTIQPEQSLSETFLGHLMLTHEHFKNAPTLDAVRLAWNKYLRPSDTIAFYYSNIPKLLAALDTDRHRTIHLKGMRQPTNCSKSLEQFMDSLAATPQAPSELGRAERRLAGTKALAHHLHQGQTS